MARVKQSPPVLEHRVGRLRLHEPDSLESLAPIAFDPNVNPKCANGGTRTLNWLLRIDTAAKTLTTGPARPSGDGSTFSFLDESVDGATLGAVCPGFTVSTPPVSLRPVTTGYAGPGVCAPPLARLTLAMFDTTSGAPILFPLQEARIDIPSLADPSCIGRFQREYLCDGGTLGWTTGASLVAKIAAEDADNVPLKTAGCQSLCANLVNKRHEDRRQALSPGQRRQGAPRVGDACIGGEGCNNAWKFTATFSSYGVNITP